MFDYKLLAALDAVINHQNFEKAADELAITQSAVSQRIKQLEEQVARPVIIRSTPMMLTETGQKLRKHYHLVFQLEQELKSDLNLVSSELSRISIALNADSLAIWFTQVISPLIARFNVEFNLIVEDENRTIEHLRSGEAMAAVSAKAQSIKGFKSVKLGDVRYILAATNSFCQKYFPEGLNASAIAKAPAASFDQRDDMHLNFVKHHFGINERHYPCHFLRSSEAIVNLAKQGGACALIPEIQILDELASGSLVNVSKNHILNEPLYWHSWLLVKGQYKALCKEIERLAQQALN